ncbi:hypothetical protein ACES2L_13740 [Bdellovibrio bacteriovorus]
MKTQVALFLLPVFFVLNVFAEENAPNEAPWVEVANQFVVAETMTLAELSNKKNTPEYSEIRVQILSSGARIQRAEVVNFSRMSMPVWQVEGDYSAGMERMDKFPLMRVRTIRMYLTTLQPFEVVQIKVMMR